jgi:hypothetical protein
MHWNFLHGHTRHARNSSTYGIWANMIQRCQNPKDDGFVNYGARGIRVCKRWLEFRNFLADMGVRPKSLTLERRNNDGDYKPSNCYWASRKEQGRNRRTNKLTREQAAEIRKLKQLKQSEIALMYGVNQSQVSRIQNGKRWA